LIDVNRAHSEGGKRGGTPRKMLCRRGEGRGMKKESVIPAFSSEPRIFTSAEKEKRKP